jgi:hypothetical protein
MDTIVLMSFMNLGNYIMLVCLMNGMSKASIMYISL